MAGPGRHGEHARSRHSGRSARPRPGRRTAPLVAFLAVIAVAVGAVWALGLREGGGGRPAGLVADNRDTGPVAADPSPAADQVSRDKREAPAPALGPMVKDTPRATPSMIHATSTTTSMPRRPGRTTTRPTTP